jgi:hypothetical protein
VGFKCALVLKRQWRKTSTSGAFWPGRASQETRPVPLVTISLATLRTVCLMIVLMLQKTDSFVLIRCHFVSGAITTSRLILYTFTNLERRDCPLHTVKHKSMNCWHTQIVAPLPHARMPLRIALAAPPPTKLFHASAVV